MLAPTCPPQHALRLCNVESIGLVFKGPWVFNVGKKAMGGGCWGGLAAWPPPPWHKGVALGHHLLMALPTNQIVPHHVPHQRHVAGLAMHATISISHCCNTNPHRVWHHILVVQFCNVGWVPHLCHSTTQPMFVPHPSHPY